MLGVARMLKYQSALQVFGAVQSAGEPEMTAKVRAGVVESAENGIGFGRHMDNIAVTSRLGGDNRSVLQGTGSILVIFAGATSGELSSCLLHLGNQCFRLWNRACIRS